MKKLKYLLGIFIFSFVGICFGNIVNAVATIGIIGGSEVQSTVNSSYFLSVDDNSNLTTAYGGLDKKYMFIDNQGIFFFTDYGPYGAVRGNQGLLAYYRVCNTFKKGDNINYPTNCINSSSDRLPITDDIGVVFSPFFNDIKNNGGYFLVNNTNGNKYVCFSSDNLGYSICFYFNTGSDRFKEGTSLGVPENSNYQYQFSLIDDNLLKDNPYTKNSGGGSGGNGGSDVGLGGIELGSNESAVNYFENRYGWNENICYVGVDNMTDLWGSSVSFQEGSGLTIFEVFEELYGNTDLDKVYVWINSRLINYGQWFGRNGDPLYLASYNSGTNQVDLRYENLTFPFTNNPVAVYFMSDYMTRNSEYDTMGSEIVSYCNLKINDGTFDEIIDQAVKNNITKYTEQSNKNKGLNSDGTVVNIDFSGLMYTGDAWLSSGVDIAFSGNTTIKNTLENFFGKIEEGLSSFESSSNYKILPDWLIASFLFIVLFKFLRKKK